MRIVLNYKIVLRVVLSCSQPAAGVGHREECTGQGGQVRISLVSDFFN